MSTIRLFITLMLCLLCVPLTTSCGGNRREPDRLAFDMGNGLDLTKDGKLEVSFQIAIPSAIGGGSGTGGGGTSKNTFELTTATGINVYDAMRRAQKELPREIFPGHREVIIIGEQLAKQGIGKLLDQFVRNPRSVLRSKLFVVKDGDAKEVLAKKTVFEPFTSLALKRQEEIFRLRYVYFHDFMTDALTEGTDPLVPAVGLTAAAKPYYYGSAVFNTSQNLKVVGYLNDNESLYANWITGKQTGFDFSSTFDGELDTISLKFKSLRSHIRTWTHGNQIHVDVLLSGSGAVVENNTKLNPNLAHDLRIIEQTANEKTQREIASLITHVQQNYRSDIFGFGNAFHIQHPERWKAVKEQWNEHFAELEVTVQTQLKCRRNSGLVADPIVVE
ncbi:Ger(x)C family spore germination protein [Paenibacillus sp. WC2504]|uniref:Ger(x)C family spore germination protein n=1 Tax=Paenibacillus sp. WC2504 TaxID=3461403 RepID=UPI0040462130